MVVALLSLSGRTAYAQLDMLGSPRCARGSLLRWSWARVGPQWRMNQGAISHPETGEHLSDDPKKANAGRRRVVLAGTTLSVLSVSNFGSQVRQAQGQQPSPTPSAPPAARNIVMVAPTDTIAAIQTKLNSVPAGGSLVLAAGTYPGLIGRSNVTVWAAGPVTVNGNFDFTGQSNWAIRGADQNNRITFNGGLVAASLSNHAAIGWCVFNNQPSNGDNGSAIDFSGASFLMIVNNDFNNVLGNCLAQYNVDNLTIGGNRFVGCYGPVSINQDSNATMGRNVRFISNLVTGYTRTGIEVTGSDPSPPNGVFTNFLVDGNWFVDVATPGPVPYGTGPVSMVARLQSGTVISNNFFRPGPNAAPNFGPAIEFDSQATAADIFGNLYESLGAYTFYDLGGNSHGNKFWNSTGNAPNDSVLTSKPADPPRPARISW